MAAANEATVPPHQEPPASRPRPHVTTSDSSVSPNICVFPTDTVRGTSAHLLKPPSYLLSGEQSFEDLMAPARLVPLLLLVFALAANAGQDAQQGA
jgi:hypothetical protein